MRARAPNLPFIGRRRPSTSPQLGCDFAQDRLHPGPVARLCLPRRQDGTERQLSAVVPVGGEILRLEEPPRRVLGVVQHPSGERGPLGLGGGVVVSLTPTVEQVGNMRLVRHGNNI